MGYPTKHLTPGELVLLDVRPHWKYLAGPALFVVLFIAGGLAALLAKVPRWADLALAAVLALSVLWLVGRYLQWVTTSLVVTSHRLISRRGILARTGREIVADRLSDISYHQSLIDRLVGAGDITIESPGRDSQEVFKDLPRLGAVLAEINRVVNLRGPRPT
jgi:uncharacterized membrane protein YdbT with pleckstrin-like domain